MVFIVGLLLFLTVKGFGNSVFFLFLTMTFLDFMAGFIITDLSMPEVDGQQLFRWLAAERPELARRTLFVSGMTDRAQLAFLTGLPNLVLDKPVSGSQLVAAIERVWNRAHHH